MELRKNKISEYETAKPHTISKFNLIEAYVKKWAQILLNIPSCKKIIFIDCMSNDGLYKNDCGETIYGTPIRVSKYLCDIMKNYTDKNCLLIFNDLSKKKITTLLNHLPACTSNFIIQTYSEDANALLKRIYHSSKGDHTLLVYDPYEASIDWSALSPYFKSWSELIINHMHSDTVRAISQVKQKDAVNKYEQTYLMKLNDLISFGTDKDKYEERIKDIIQLHRGASSNNYYVASFPFFNSTNNIVYNLIHCSNHIKGFELFKNVAWKTFGGKSSKKKTYGNENQFSFNFNDGLPIVIDTDDSCYQVYDIASYIYNNFKNKGKVTFTDVWGCLMTHPVFPSEGYRDEVKKILRDHFNVIIKKSTFDFS